ncbi:MAG: MarR family transcriptional regulator [Anaerolineae bacterium]|nr:MarR family transcriptional regulator [Anaerolineae bacterium]
MNEHPPEEKIEAALIRLDELWGRFIRQVSAEIKEYPHSMPLTQLYVLRLLDRRGPLSMSELSQWLGISMSGCTALVNRLMAGGWVERQRDPNDRRIVLVGVSLIGEQKLTEIRQSRARIFARYLTHLEPDEIETLLRLSERIFESVSEEQTDRVEVAMPQ